MDRRRLAKLVRVRVVAGCDGPESVSSLLGDAGEGEAGEPSAFCIICGSIVARRSGYRCKVTWIPVYNE